MEKAGATYETQQLSMLATDLKEYGAKEIWNACVPNLTWTHFRHLLRVQDEKARNWYMHEASTQLS